MIRAAVLFSLITLAPAFALAQTTSDQCYTCHQALEDDASKLFAGDIHRARGISCAGCHGGNPAAEDMEVGMAASAGFIGVPKGDAISKACEQCHSNASRMKELGSSLGANQAALLREGVHGRLSFTGKEQMLQCTSCHGAHGIAPASSRRSKVHPVNITATCGSCHSNASYMRNYNPALPVDQIQKYRTSVHGALNAKGDANAAECASCHGSHDIRAASDVKSKVYPTNLPATCASCHSDVKMMRAYKISVDQYEEYATSVHGRALLEKHDLSAPACNDCHGNHGAVPPGVQSISQVCGTCHALNADLFSKSPHKKAFDALKLPECETCHGNHQIVAATDQLLGVAPEAVCSQCHSPEQSAAGYVVARTMRSLIDSLNTLEQSAQSLVDEAEQKGMEISDAKFRLRDVRQARFESRTTVHSFNREQFEEVVGKGLSAAASVSVEAQEAVDEYYFRRWGLGVSTLIISVLALSLYLTIRRIERKKP